MCLFWAHVAASMHGLAGRLGSLVVVVVVVRVEVLPLMKFTDATAGSNMVEGVDAFLRRLSQVSRATLHCLLSWPIIERARPATEFRVVVSLAALPPCLHTSSFCGCTGASKDASLTLVDVSGLTAVAPTATGVLLADRGGSG